MTNKLMTWVLIMAFLVSQSYAYASAPCESNANGTSQHNNHMDGMIMVGHSLTKHVIPDDMQHDIHKKMQKSMHKIMPQKVLQQALSMDCCDEECHCPTGTSSSVTLSHFMSVTALFLVSQPSALYLFSIQDTFMPSSRKPPIIS